MPESVVELESESSLLLELLEDELEDDDSAASTSAADLEAVVAVFDLASLWVFALSALALALSCATSFLASRDLALIAANSRLIAAFAARTALNSD